MYYLRRLLVALVLASLCGAFSVSAEFSDVPFGHSNGEAITFLTDQGYIKGNPDGTFKPGSTINRAEFLTVLLRLQGEDLTIKAMGSCFPDVAIQAWYAHAACRGKALGIVDGGPTGKFRAGDPVSVVEAAKMLAVSQHALVEMPLLTQQWYDPYLRYLERHGAILDTLYYVSQPLTRGEVAEMVWRVREGRGDLPSVRTIQLSSSACTPLPKTSPIQGVLMYLVQETWLGWYNAERSRVGAPPLVLSPELNRTAQTWAETSKQRGYIDHKRGTNVYYDYNRIKSWFAQQGVTFTSRGTQFGESIGWNVYSCREDNCTQSLITAIRSTFDFFYSEKGRSYRPHYDMMVNRAYREMGVGVAVDPASRKYYLVAHLAVDVAGESLAYCPAR